LQLKNKTKQKQKTLRTTAVGGMGQTLIVGTIWIVWSVTLDKEEQIHNSGISSDCEHRLFLLSEKIGWLLFCFL